MELEDLKLGCPAMFKHLSVRSCISPVEYWTSGWTVRMMRKKKSKCLVWWSWCHKSHCFHIWKCDIVNCCSALVRTKQAASHFYFLTTYKNHCMKTGIRLCWFEFVFPFYFFFNLNLSYVKQKPFKTTVSHSGLLPFSQIARLLMLDQLVFIVKYTPPWCANCHKNATSQL